MDRVVWINKSPWLKPGPIVYVGLLNALSFAQEGIWTDYFVGSNTNSDTDADLRQFYSVEPHPYLKIHRVSETRGWRRSVYVEALAGIEKYCREGDDVLALTRELGGLSLLLKLKKKHRRLKVLHEAHDFYVVIKHLETQKYSASNLRRKWAEKYLIPKSDGLICITEYQRALYQQCFPRLPVIALPLGCLDLKHRSDLEQRRLKRRIAYIGHLERQKGLSLIFELARQLRDAGVEMDCYGGYKRQIGSLQSRVREEGLEGTLCFTSFISPRELHGILDKEISLGLVPLQDSFYNRYLTCPTKALDLIAHGLPTVASDLPSLRDVLGQSGCYCGSWAATQFAEQAVALLDHPARYAAASDESYKRASQLSWSLRARRILDFSSKL
jgi:glycosyltransferase involved in cell wall biosynthesis